MKRFLLCACALLMLLPMLLTVSSCEMATQDDEYEIAECITMDALPSFTELAASLLGGKDQEEEKEQDCLSPSGTTHLIVMCYGTPDADHLKERLRFTLVSGEEILYDEACVQVGDVTEYDIPNNPFHGVAQRNIEGIMVVTFDLLTGKEGMLYVDYLAYGGESATRAGAKTILQAPVGHNQKGQSVSVDSMKVGFLTEEAYNNGDFAEANITATPKSEMGAPTYMILDMAFSAREDNEGEFDLCCHVCFDLRTVEDVTVEAAPTNKTAKESMGDVLDVCMTYSIPPARDGQKSVRMILRVAAPNVEEAGMHLYLSGSNGMLLEGTVYIPDVLSAEDAFEAYAPAWKQDKMPTWGKILILLGFLAVWIIALCYYCAEISIAPEWWEWLLPTIAGVISSTVMALMFFAGSFAWWAVLAVSAGACVILVVATAIAAHIVDDNVGKLWPVVLSLLLSGTAFILLVTLSSLIWWAMLLVGLGITAALTLVAGAIGYHS